ncbi:hypothetical protein FNAPI_4698 [Fusarium napiforme]|uniref:Uncharacterized protein n=1 Tax=Fusarium napiforme TaxID=42672 RepID=A0A8H5NBZ0_9HYPO|nr:hypothetical protein FNAPI_4698 [Fusarium napiforme]
MVKERDDLDEVSYQFLSTATRPYGSNTPALKGGDEETLFKGNAEKSLNIFVRHNHLGVNRLVITEGQERPESEEAHNYWWTCYVQKARPFHFKARFDGIKIRNLVVVKTPSTFLNFALSCWEPNEVLCLHFPMNLNERVSELWVRQYPERKATLIIVTDRGRSLILGTQQDGPGATYHAVARLPHDRPCFMFYTESYGLSWFHFDSVSSWERPQDSQIQPAWKTAPDMTIGTHYSSAKLDGVREITPCIKRGFFTWGEDKIIQGLLLTYYDGTRTCIGEVRCDDLGTPQRVTSDTLWIRYVECKEIGSLDENTHCCDCGIEWLGFSQPLLGSISSNKDMDDRIDEQDSDEEQTSDQDDSPAEGESEDDNESEDENESDDGYERSPNPNDEMLHVLAEDAKTDRDDPVSKSCTILTGDITSKNIRDVEKFAEEFDNYGVYGL